jgi:hypothetical protein
VFGNKDIKFIFEDAENGTTIFSVDAIEKPYDEPQVRKLVEQIKMEAHDMSDGTMTDNFDSIMRIVSAALHLTCEVAQDDISWHLPVVVKRNGMYLITRTLRNGDEILHTKEKK